MGKVLMDCPVMLVNLQNFTKFLARIFPGNQKFEV